MLTGYAQEPAPLSDNDLDIETNRRHVGGGAVAVKRRRTSTKEQGAKQILTLRARAFHYIVTGSTLMLILIPIIMLLQGFHLWGFNLPDHLLYALVAMAIGKLIESLLIVMRFLFRA